MGGYTLKMPMDNQQQQQLALLCPPSPVRRPSRMRAVVVTSKGGFNVGPAVAAYESLLSQAAVGDSWRG